MAEHAGLKAVAESTGKFANDFLRIVSNDVHQNLIMSPLSAQIVLAMAAYGAGGKTATEIRKALSIPEENELGLSGYQSLIKALRAAKGVELRLANKIYTASQFEIKSAYKELTAAKFFSESQQVDFGNPPAAAETINAWCEEQTNKRITKVITPDSVTDDTRLVLVNAVYFKGQWAKKFDATLTEDKLFHIDEQTTKMVPTMFKKNKYRFGEISELSARFIEIPYQGGELSMLIILPHEINGLKTVQDNLHQVNLGQVLAESFPTDVELSLPKFKIESTLNLEEHLKKLGMEDMFGDQADFSGITDTPLKVSKVVQKAFIEVNEEGSEAAAVTGMVMMTRCMVFSAEMIVNRPFIYAIVSLTRGVEGEDEAIVPLFTGQITDPSL